MKVLITGANGFIGHHLFDFFLQNKYEVIGIDQFIRNPEEKIICADLTDSGEMKEHLSQISPDIIIHCAGAADVGKSVKDPKMDYESNVSITHDLLFALHELGLHNTRFVFLSSAGIYGNPEVLPIREDMTTNPLSPYALHKIMCEECCKYFSRNYGMDMKIVRIFSAYGCGLKKQIFWDMFNKVQNTGRLDMFGTGKESRDYIHISDLVRAIGMIVEKAPREEIIYNVANGEEITIQEVATEFAKAVQLDESQIFFDGQGKEGNPINWKADISKLQKLGYSKQKELRDGVLEYVQWAQKEVLEK